MTTKENAKPKEKEIGKLNKFELFAYLEHIAEEKKISIDEIIEIMHGALEKSFRTNFDPDANIEIVIDKEKKEFKITNHSKIVVNEEVPKKNRPIEISLKEAQKINKDIKEGDQFSEEVDFSAYSNVIADQIGQFFRQKLSTKYKEMIFEKYKDLKGEIVKAEITAVFPQYVLFTLKGGVEAFMPNVLRNNRQPLSVGNTTEVYVEDVRESGKGSQIIVSNGSPQIVKRFLELEVPEMQEGVVELMSISRIPGYRTKIAIKSNNSNVEPMGSVVGPKGARINQVSKHLFEEKIDVIRWEEDPIKFIANAVSPARVISVMPKDIENSELGKIVVVPNKQHTLAIGRGGLNVRLASILTKEKLDIISVDEARKHDFAFEWNGNVTPEQVEQIEAGERMPGSTLLKSNQRYQKPAAPIHFGDFDSEISDFNEQIKSAVISPIHHIERKHTSTPKSVSTNKPNVHGEQDNDLIVEDIEFEDVGNAFSDEDLRQMEQEFGFNSASLDNIPDFENDNEEDEE